MKKSLLALAVLGAFVGAASAQSSVTVFGVVDLSLANVKNDGSDARKSMNSNALNSNRFGFRGVEDLGGGLSAKFHLEAGMSNDIGTAGGGNSLGTAPANSNGAALFNRRSTVGLAGKFGEVRLGREYSPSFWNTTIFDPFGTNGLGSSLNVARAPGSSYVRTNNSLGYHLPALGGVYGEVMVAPGEGAAGKYSGGRIGFGAGPINVALAVGNTNLDAAGTLKAKVFNIAGSYKVGPATLMAQLNNDKADLAANANAGSREAKESRILLGANVVMGQGEIRAAWVKTDTKNNTNQSATLDESQDDASQIALGYIYNLSPRTALYGTYSSISNKGRATFSVAGGTAITAAPTAGGKSKGYEAGLRHSF